MRHRMRPARPHAILGTTRHRMSNIIVRSGRLDFDDWVAEKKGVSRSEIQFPRGNSNKPQKTQTPTLARDIMPLRKLRAPTVQAVPLGAGAVVKLWIGFTASIVILGAGLHLAGMYQLFGVNPATWDLAALAYPGLGLASAGFYALKFDGDAKQGALVAESMNGLVEPENSRLQQLSNEVFALTGVRGQPPRLFVVPSREPNAFAAGTGRGGESVVAVTWGLLDLLTEKEVRAVLAHEAGHLRNQDVGRNLVIAAMVSGLGFIMSIGDWLLYNTRGSRQSYNVDKVDEKNDSKKDDFVSRIAAASLILYVTGAASYALATLVRLSSSRTAEFAADDFAKSIGAGPDLAAALQKLDTTTKDYKRDELGAFAGAFAHSYIHNPPARESMIINLGGLLRSHPPSSERIARLLQDEAD